MKKFILPILILGLMMAAMPSYAAIYVDSDNGDDNNVLYSCAIDTPCATFAASKHLLGEDYVMYLSGEFNEQIQLYQSDSGTAESPKTISVWPGRTASITYAGDVINVLGTSYFIFDGLTITNNNTTSKNGITMNGSGNVSIANCTVYNIGKTAIQANNALGLSVSDNTIYNTTGAGINIVDNGSEITIIGNTIYNTGLDAANPAIKSTSAMNVLNNNLYSNTFGIIVNGIGVDNITISNNFVSQNSQTSLMLLGQVNTANIYNNTFYEENLNQILYIDGAYSGFNLSLNNNIFYLADSTGLIYYADSMVENFDSDYNIFYAPNLPSSTMFNIKGTQYMLSEWQTAGYDADSLNSDPLYTSTSDFHLTSTSPAIDAGKALDEVTDDYDGDTRYWGTGYDIGADEYVYLTTPENLSSTPYITTSTISWDEVNQATSYNIKYGKGQSLNGAKVVDLTSDTNSLEVTALEHGGRYYWKVQAVNGDTVSEWSETKRMVTNPRKIKKGEIKVAAKEATQARIKINSMAKRITGFNIILAKKSGKTYTKVKTVKVSNKSGKTYTYKWLTGLKADTKYRIRVKARRKIGSKTYLSQTTINKYFTTLSE